MARPALAPLDRLEKLLGAEYATIDTVQAGARMEDASEHVRAFAGVDWLNTTTGALEGVPEQVGNVVATMVERASRNPAGVTQEGSGPFTRSFGPDAASRLYLTRGERLIVRRAVGRNSIGTLSTGRGPLETATAGEGWPGYTDDASLPAGWPQ